MASWDLSVIYSLRFVLLGLLAGLCVPGCHRSCPGMSQGLDGVLHPGLTFGDEFNHSKYPVSSFPKRKGGLRLSVSLFSAQHLLTQLPGPSAMILSQFCTSGFLSCLLMCADVLDSLEWLKWHETPIFNPELIIFFL